jgi:hypothetical protein
MSEYNNQKISDHRDLLVWRKAMDLTKAVYDCTGKFPKDERFGPGFSIAASCGVSAI